MISCPISRTHVRNGWKAGVGSGAAVWHYLPMKGLRYLAYLGFAVGTFAFWALFYMLVPGFFPFPAEPACGLEPKGCPPPSVWEHLGILIVVFGTIPLTALVFVFFRRWVRAKVGLLD